MNKLTKTEINSILNTEQLYAVKYIKGNIIVNAGPGTGKTKTICHKVQYLINNYNIDPQNILLISFSNESVNDLKSKLNNLLPTKTVNNINCTTFHSFCSKHIVKTSKIIYLTENELDSIINNMNTFISKIDKKLIYQMTDINKYLMYCTFKKYGVKDSSLKNTKNINVTILKKIYDKYKILKGNRNDYNDCLGLFYKALSDSSYESILSTKYQFIIVDEAQDNNLIQNEILLKLQKLHQSKFTIVGDTNQAIYGFRGSSPNSMEYLKTQLSEYVETTFIKSYRFTKSNMTFINEIGDTFPNYKKIKGMNQRHNIQPITKVFNFDIEEYNFIINQVTHLLEKGVKPCTITFLFRNKKHSEAYQQIFKTEDIEYNLFGNVLKSYNNNPENLINIETIHSSKGKEYDYIFLPGCSDDTFFKNNKDISKQKLEEEHRVFYVAITRVVKELIITSYKIGKRKHYNKPVFREIRFISENKRKDGCLF